MFALSKRRMIVFALLVALLLSACGGVSVNVNVGPTAQPTSADSAPEATATTEPTAAAPTEAAPAGGESPTEAPTALPAETAVPGSGTAVPQTVPTTASNPQGTAYTLVFTEAQINGWFNNAISSTQTDFVSSSGVSLQNGQISKNTVHSAAGPGGKTVNGQIVLGVSAANCDLGVTVVKATVGQFAMTDARAAAISNAFELALSTALAQAHDYTCVDSVTIANGVMTVTYH